MTAVHEQRRGQESCEDLLWSAASIDRSVAGLRAEQFEYLHDFVMKYKHDTAVVALAGRERLVRYGGAGTPLVPEFAVAQVGAEMGLSAWAAQKLVADAMSLIYRLPGVFAALKDGEVAEWRARMAATATRELRLDQVAAVDARLTAGYPQGSPLVARVGRKRLDEIIDQVRAVGEAEAVADEAAAALADRDVSIRPGRRGTADIAGSLSEADGARLRQRLGQVVGWLAELGDTRPQAVLRSVALGMLADPGALDRLYAWVHAHRTGQATFDDDHGEERTADERAATDATGRPQASPSQGPASLAGRLPATVLYVHFDRASGTWSLDGTGPITPAEAQDLVGHSTVTVKPVIDLEQNLSYTGYVAPPRLKEQLAQMNAGRCIFPSCDKPAWDGDYDHSQNWDPNAPPGTPGCTDSRNGAMVCRFHHRTKTHTRWTVESPAPGTWLWHGPRHDAYLVTAGTTTRLHTG